MEEYFPLVNESGEVIGRATRTECHSGSFKLHPVVHLHVFNSRGELYLQKRSMSKDIQPGKWDTAVGGHLALGEDYETGARRELMEELGVTSPVELEYLFDGKIRNAIESEDTRVFGLRMAEGFEFQRSEIDAIRFWSANELFDPANRANFTPNLCAELDELRNRGLI